MSLSRRDFIKLFGVSLGSLLLVRCQRLRPAEPTPTCYAPVAPTPSDEPGLDNLGVRDALRVCWLSFDKLADQTRNNPDSSIDYKNNAFVQKLTGKHRSALDQLVADGELSAPVADLVQEAYAAAIYHVWRSNAPITCYEPAYVDYTPQSAAVLVEQSRVLDEIAGQGNVDPATLEKARLALEHDLAFYALTDADVQALYDTLIKEMQQSGGPAPSFEELELQLTPEARQAAEFLVELLSEK
jgi:hypothetical protein